MASLLDKRILVVEDEPLLAMLAEDLLEEAGARTVGPASSVAQAILLIESSSIDAAILDVNLGGERSFDVADRLLRRGVPFIFATGYDTADCDRYETIEIVEKPYSFERIMSALERAMDSASA